MSRVAAAAALTATLALAAGPARSLGTASAGGRRFATLGGEVTAIEPLAGGRHLLVRGRHSCFFVSVDEVRRPGGEKPAGFLGSECDSAATDGEDSAAVAAPGRVGTLEFVPDEPAPARLGRMRPLFPERNDRRPDAPAKPPLAAAVTRFAPDGKSLVFGDRSGRVLVAPYPGNDKEPREMDAMKAAVTDLRFVSGGDQLAGMDAAGAFRVWDWSSERAVPGPGPAKGPVRAIAAAARAPVFARWRERVGVEVFSLPDWRKTRVILLPEREPRVFELSPDGRWLALSESGVVAVYDLKTGKGAGFVAHGLGAVTALAFLPGGLAAVGGGDGKLAVLRVPQDLAPSVGPEELAAAAAAARSAAPSVPAAESAPAGAMPAMVGIAPPTPPRARVEPPKEPPRAAEAR